MRNLKKAIKSLICAAAAVCICLASGCSAFEAADTDDNAVTLTPPFWVVQDSDTGAEIYLLGSMHAGLENTVYPDYVLTALESSDWVAPEMDTTAFAEDTELQQKCVQYLMLSGTTMQELLGSDYDAAAEFFRKKGIYQAAMDYMIPYYWASAATSLVIDGAGLDTEYGTETVLLELAYSKGIEIREIEGGESQYKMMSEIPMSVQLETLAECVGDDKVSAQVETTKELYDAWSTFDDEYFSTIAVYDTDTVGSAEDWQKYYDLMYTDRQKVMADFVITALENGEKGFVFVGAMHYYAEPSILSQLEAAGYTVTAIRTEALSAEEKAA